MNKLGRHLLVEFTGCDRAKLNDLNAIRTILMEAARKAGATVVNSTFHEYNPHGLSGVVVIAESHMSIHTWPEYGYAAVDFFTCGERVDPWKACWHVKEQLACNDMYTREMARGIPGGEDAILPHKPAEQMAAERCLAPEGT